MTSKALARVILGVVSLSLIAIVSGAQSVPPRLADTTYWRMITEMSEPDGFFRSDNLVGNEGSMQRVIPRLQKELSTGGVSVYNAFFNAGPDLTYSFGQGNGGNFGGRGYGGRGMPTFGALLLATDSAGVNHAYLSSEAGYRWLRDFQARNLLVPVIGDFAGPKALRAVGQWVRAHDAKSDAMYVSNVEQYLFMSPDAWRRYYENVATLPISERALFIRSLSSGAFRPVGQQSPTSRSVQLVSSVAELLAAFAEGKITSYQDVIAMTKR